MNLQSPLCTSKFTFTGKSTSETSVPKLSWKFTHMTLKCWSVQNIFILGCKIVFNSSLKTGSLGTGYAHRSSYQCTLGVFEAVTHRSRFGWTVKHKRKEWDWSPLGFVILKGVWAEATPQKLCQLRKPVQNVSPKYKAKAVSLHLLCVFYQDQKQTLFNKLMGFFKLF